jgi:cell surface protein SprA
MPGQAFRNVNFDIRSYKKLRMYVHAESRRSHANNPIAYGDVSVFIRLGNDYEQNYYEYEIPAVPSAFFNSDPYSVWPEANNMIIEFAKLNDVKIQRNQEGFAVNLRYTQIRRRPAHHGEGQPEPEPHEHHHDRHPQPEKGWRCGQSRGPMDDGTSKCVKCG